MDYGTDNYERDDDTITGWDEHLVVEIETDNCRSTPVKVQIRRNFPVTSWELENLGKEGYGHFEKIDADSVQYTMDLDGLRAGRSLTT